MTRRSQQEGRPPTCQEMYRRAPEPCTEIADCAFAIAGLAGAAVQLVTPRSAHVAWDVVDLASIAGWEAGWHRIV